MNAEKRRKIYQQLAIGIPNPTTELIYQSNFELLIAVVLSAQSTDIGVNKVTPRLFELANTPQAILDLGQEELENKIKTLGLFRSKAKNIIGLCQLLLKNYNGEVPDSRIALESLPGVGRKTANVLLNTAFGQAVIAVDTHIFRVANRTGLAAGKDVRSVEDKLHKLTPKEFLIDAHHLLLLHGRYVCKARAPECWHCRIFDLCEYPSKAKKLA